MSQKQISTGTWVGIGCGIGCLLLLIAGGAVLVVGGRFLFRFMPKTTTYEQAQREAYFLVMKPTYLPPGTTFETMMMMNAGNTNTPVSWMQMLTQSYRHGRSPITIVQMRGNLPRDQSGFEAVETVNGRQVHVQRLFKGARVNVMVRYDTTMVMVSGAPLDEMKKVAASMEPVFPDQLQKVLQAQKSHPVPFDARPPDLPTRPNAR